MTAATVTTRLDVNDPVKEVVELTFTDGYTYVSKKFGSVKAVQATFNEDMKTMDYPLSCAISAGTVTLHCSGASAKLCCLTLYGNK